MDSRLLIGPGIPTPDPTTRAPWYISSISPHRLMELSPVSTAVSILIHVANSICLFVCLALLLAVWRDTPRCDWSAFVRRSDAQPRQVVTQNYRAHLAQ